MGMCGILMLDDKLAANIVDDWCLIKQNPAAARVDSPRCIARLEPNFSAVTTSRNQRRLDMLFLITHSEERRAPRHHQRSIFFQPLP
jgi:hypothetical protein